MYVLQYVLEIIFLNIVEIDKIIGSIHLQDLLNNYSVQLSIYQLIIYRYTKGGNSSRQFGCTQIASENTRRQFE